MNKKDLQKLTNSPHYNQTLFTQAVSVVQNIQKAINLCPSSQKDKQIIIKKQAILQNTLKNAINVIGKFIGTTKLPLATPIDYSLQIFQALTDTIQTSVQKYKESIKSTKKQTSKNKDKKSTTRPQQIYENIKPAIFDYHNHQKCTQYIRTDLQITKSLQLSCQFAYISTLRQLQIMIEQLKGANQIAIDLQHSNKSYQGLTCLIQISSRKKDYIIDVFPIWQHIYLLKPIIQDPKIIKVMHGADMDTKWLQRDFNIHIVNLFDTYRASRIIGFQKLSYAFLLNHYCQVNTDKTYQTADWRQRPLPEEMIHYARLDTHYLLQIYDRLRCDIHQKAITMKTNPQQLFIDIYNASYEVTLNQVQLFNFKQRQNMQNLRKQYKDAQFKLFLYFFGVIDNIAAQKDMNYDQVLSLTVEKNITMKLKQLLTLKKVDYLNQKVDKIIFDLKTSQNQLLFITKTKQMKQFLLDFIQNRIKQKYGIVQNKKQHKIVNEQLNIYEQYDKKQQKIQNICFKQYSIKTYGNLMYNPFSTLKLQPISLFLANKLGVSTKQEDIDENDIQNQQSNLQSESMKMKDIQEALQGQDQNIIQFKRINPNAQVIEEQNKPRKKRKQHEYQKKIRQKQGNIYQLLEQ